MGYYRMRVRVTDQNGEAVSGARVKLTNTAGVGQAYPDSFTNDSGDAYFYDVVSGTQFKYTVTPPTGYTCVTCYKFFTFADKDVWMALSLNRVAPADVGMHVLVRTSSGANIQNAAITIDGVHRGYTGYDGKFFIRVPGGRYVVKASKSGYMSASDSVNLTSTQIVNLTMDVVADPTPQWCFCDVEVTDADDLPIDAKVCIPGAEGPDCQQTGTDGITTFQLKQGTYYTATATKDGYEDYQGFGTRSFTTPNHGVDFLALRLNDTTPPEDVETGEVAEITNVTYPAEARKGDEFDVVVFFKNIGDETCELRARLLDAGQYDEVIDTEPDVQFENPAPGLSGHINLTTNWHAGEMPAHDWRLAVELIEINRLTNAVQKIHDRRNFTVKLTTVEPTPIPDEPIPGTGELTIDAPLAAIAGDIKVSGTAPPGQSVQIVVSDVKWGIDLFAKDDVIKTVTSSAEGEYTATVTLDEFGAIGVYARIKKEGWLGIDILAKDIVSGTSTIWVLTYPIIAMLGIVMLLVYDKMSGGRLRKMIKRGK